MEDFKKMLEKVSSLTEDANVDLVFGKPEQVGDRTLIPVGEVMYGFGMGAGMAADEEAEGTPQPPDVPMGAGGGGGAKVRPLAYIEIGPERTRIEPIIDEQKVALAGIMLVAWIVMWVMMVVKSAIKD